MKGIRAWVFASATVLAALAALAGCGGDGGPADDASAGGDASRTPDGGGAPDVALSPDAAPAGDLAELTELLEALAAATTDAQREGLVDAFFMRVAYSGGFPIREDGVLAFAWFDEARGGGTFTVAGDFNGWDGDALPLDQPVAGFPFYVRIVPVSEPLPRTLYKLVRHLVDDSVDWFADPWARRYGYDDFGEYSLAEAGAAPSHLERWPRFSDGAGGLDARTLLVYVPRDLPAGGARVVYMHDGQNIFDPQAFFGGWHAQEAADGAIAGGVEPFFIVGIPNTPARFEEYTPVTEMIGGSVAGGRADEYVAFLSEGIKPFIDARYPTRVSAADTAVVGSSLGGVASMYALWARPDVFGHAGSLSGTLWWGGGTLSNPTMMHMYGMTPPPGSATFYLDSGGDDGGGCVDSDGDGVHDDGSDSDNYCPTLDMVDVLAPLGNTVDYQWDPGAPHNEAAWSARLPDLLLHWFPGGG